MKRSPAAVSLFVRACVLLGMLFSGLGSFAQVVINEIHYDPPDKTKPVEFIELHNAGAAAVNLAGWQLASGVEFVFPAGTTIAAGGYVVVAQNPVAFQARYSTGALGPWTGKLSNNGEKLLLRDANAAVIDEVNYGVGFPWPTASRGGGQSMELIHPSLDNDLGGSWRASVDKPSTIFVGRGTTGWHYRAGNSEASSPTNLWRLPDFVENASWLTTGRTPIGYGDSDGNTTTVDVNSSVGGMQNSFWSLFLRRTFTMAAGQIPPTVVLRLRCDDGCIVWINGMEIAPRIRVNNAVPVFNGVAGGMVVTEAPEPVLPWESDIVIDNAQSILREGTNVLAVQLFNATLNSPDAFLDAEIAIPGAEEGTPGGPNSVYSTIVPPQIRQVAHTPVQPAANVPVVVTAKITDPDGVGSVTLSYQLVNPGSYIRKSDAAYSTAWTNVAMHDDGADGDAVAGDGTFSATLPAVLQVHRRLVRYRIAATDTGGASVTVPYADDEQPNFAYFVYNGAPAWTGAFRPTAFAGFPATAPQTFPATLLNSIQPYHIIANATDVANSQFNGSFNDVRFPCTLVYDGVVYDHIQFKNRGQVSTYTTGKNKWGFFFDRARDFHPRDNWGRPYQETWNSFGLNANASPWVSLHRGSAGVEEAVSNRVYDLAGGLSERTHYVHLRVIDDAAESGPTQYDGDLWGLYLAMEPTEGNMLDERGLPDGNVYDIVGSGGEKKHQGVGQPTDSSDWNTFRDAVQAAGQTEAYYRANEDLPSLYTFLALNRLTGNVDVRPGDNYRYYHRSTDGRWVVIPYDLDMQFIPGHEWSGSMDGVIVAGQPLTVRTIGRYPALALEFRNRCRELLSLLAGDASRSGGQIGQLIDEYAQMVNPTGQTLTWANLDAAMWNLNPHTTGDGVNRGISDHKGNFYRALYYDGARGLGGVASTNSWIRTLPDPDGDGFSNHEGLTQWFIDYATNTYPVSAPTWLRKAVSTGGGDDPSLDRQKGYGYKYLEWESGYGGFLNATAEPSGPGDLAVPNTPTITYLGTAGFPSNALDFKSSNFSPAASGGTTFAAMQWRIGEIYAPGISGYIAGEPRKYEIEEVWTSAELPAFAATVRVPLDAAHPGRTYRARVRHKDANGRWSFWSAPVQFVTGTPDVTVYQQSIVVSEVSYNPAPVTPAEFAAGYGSDDFEWIEVKNVSALPLDCTGLRFTKGVDFDFPAGYTIPAGGFALVVKNPAAFQLRYGLALNAIIAGAFPTDNLSNNGENLKLSYGAGVPIVEFAYSDAAPWPAEADGSGKTLTLRQPNTRPDPTDPANWRASSVAGGSPGADDVLTYALWAGADPALTDPLGDADRDGLSNLLEYALGSPPTVPGLGALPIQGVQTFTVSSATADYLTLTFTRPADATDLQYFVDFSTNMQGWLPNGAMVSSVPGPNGTITETWRAPVSLVAAPRQYGRVRVVKP